MTAQAGIVVALLVLCVVQTVLLVCVHYHEFRRSFSSPTPSSFSASFSA